ncbi:hypothetical protein B9Z55_008054 [Caenorhabditis nigoni]|nr:hypothetical protein B9Z55_008054 [Caenorhabditis nigoni]
MKQVEIVLTALTLFNSFKNRETSSGRIPELSEAPRVLRPSPAVDHSQISTASQGYQDQSGRHHHSNQGYQHNYDHNQIPNVSQGHQSQGYTQSSYYNQASHNPSNYSNPHSSNTSYSTRRHQQPPLPKMDFSQVTNVSKNFKEQLSQMTVGESNLSEVYSTTPQTPKTTTFGPSDLEKAEINRLELQKDEEERKREERLFEIEMSNQRASNERREEEMREKKTEMDHLADLEFQKKYAEQAKRHEESYRRAREEIEDYEKETQRLLEDQIRQWKACNNTFLACVQMKHLFEKKEKEWSDWLNTLGSAINSAKARFRLFENLLRSLDRSQPSFERIVKKSMIQKIGKTRKPEIRVTSELLAIHKSTLSAYDLIFEAYETIQNLFEKFPERVFLQTLLQSLVSVSDQICATLENIDYGLENIDLIDPIRQSFSRLSRWEIPSTSKLREESKNENVGVLIGKPRVYNAGSSLRISEIY